jgi:hypothetical protein
VTIVTWIGKSSVASDVKIRDTFSVYQCVSVRQTVGGMPRVTEPKSQVTLKLSDSLSGSRSCKLTGGRLTVAGLPPLNPPALNGKT